MGKAWFTALILLIIVCLTCTLLYLFMLSEIGLLIASIGSGIAILLMIVFIPEAQNEEKAKQT